MERLLNAVRIMTSEIIKLRVMLENEDEEEEGDVLSKDLLHSTRLHSIDSDLAGLPNLELVLGKDGLEAS